MERGIELKRLFDDGNQHVGADSRPDLDLRSVFACAEKVLYAQVLLDPFEEELDLPAVFVQGCDGGGRQTGVVGQKDRSLACGGVGKPKYAEYFRDSLGRHKGPRAQYADRRSPLCFDPLGPNRLVWPAGLSLTRVT